MRIIALEVTVNRFWPLWRPGNREERHGIRPRVQYGGCGSGQRCTRRHYIVDEKNATVSQAVSTHLECSQSVGESKSLVQMRLAFCRTGSSERVRRNRESHATSEFVSDEESLVISSLSSSGGMQRNRDDDVGFRRRGDNGCRGQEPGQRDGAPVLERVHDHAHDAFKRKRVAHVHE